MTWPLFTWWVGSNFYSVITCQVSNSSRPDYYLISSQCSLGSAYRNNNLTREKEHAQLVSLSRNRILNISSLVSLVGEVIILAIIVGILKAVKSEETTENNTRAFSILLAFSGGIWRESLHQLVHAWFKGLYHSSPLCVTMVHLRKKTTGPGSTHRN